MKAEKEVSMILKDFFLTNLILNFISYLIHFVIKLASLGSNLKFNYIRVVTPNILMVCLYYIFTFLRIRNSISF